MSRLWTARLWIAFCGCAAGSSGSAEVIPKALARMLAMLRQLGVVKPHQPAVAGNAQSRITSEFGRHLLQECGRSPSTLLNYVPFNDQFLSERFHGRAPNLAMLRAPDVTGFVMRHAHLLSPLRAGLMVTALRSFFRYLRNRGAIATDLAGCVPSVPNWSLSTLPRFLPAAAVERMLKRCDRKTSVGRRNHAILLLLARLGVRAGEVVGPSLDDIDWSAGQITITWPWSGQRNTRITNPMNGRRGAPSCAASPGTGLRQIPRQKFHHSVCGPTARRARSHTSIPITKSKNC